MAEHLAELREMRKMMLDLIEQDMLETMERIERGPGSSNVHVQQHLQRTAYLRRHLDTLDELEKSNG